MNCLTNKETKDQRQLSNFPQVIYIQTPLVIGIFQLYALKFFTYVYVFCLQVSAPHHANQEKSEDGFLVCGAGVLHICQPGYQEPNQDLLEKQLSTAKPSLQLPTTCFPLHTHLSSGYFTIIIIIIIKLSMLPIYFNIDFWAVTLF